MNDQMISTLKAMGVAVEKPAQYRTNPEKRLEWLRALRGFKKGLAVRYKLGILEHYCKEVAAHRSSGKSLWEQPDWDTPYWRDKLYDAISTGTAPPDLLLGFAQSIGRTYHTQQNPRVVDYMHTVDKIVKAQSFRLRLKFGVISELR